MVLILLRFVRMTKVVVEMALELEICGTSVSLENDQNYDKREGRF